MNNGFRRRSLVRSASVRDSDQRCRSHDLDDLGRLDSYTRPTTRREHELNPQPREFAGLWYLLLIAIGPLVLIYIPNRLFVHGNAAATVNNIAAHERLFRIGILAELVGGVILISSCWPSTGCLRAWTHLSLCWLVILGGVMPGVIYFVNVVNDFAADFLSVFDKPQRDALAMVFLRLHNYQINASLVLAGAWLFPLAALVYRSRFLPRFLGVGLATGGFGWLILSLTAILAAQYQDRLFVVFQPAFFGEIALTLWLVIKGAKPPALNATASLAMAG